MESLLGLCFLSCALCHGFHLPTAVSQLLIAPMSMFPSTHFVFVWMLPSCHSSLSLLMIACAVRRTVHFDSSSSIGHNWCLKPLNTPPWYEGGDSLLVDRPWDTLWMGGRLLRLKGGVLIWSNTRIPYKWGNYTCVSHQKIEARTS